MFGQDENDVVFLSAESGDEGDKDDGDSCPDWTTQVEDAKQDWVVRFPNANPYIYSKVELTDDGWYHGEDCASPSEAAPSAKHPFLPAADGSLALKADTVLPGAAPGSTKFGDRSLERQVHHDKARRKGHEEFDPISQGELDDRAQENLDAFRRDSFWADQMEHALYYPTKQDGPVNFTVESASGKMAIPYRIAAPMAWEYPYTFGQAQESLQDRLVTASLYGIRLVRPVYTDPWSCLAAPATAKFPAAKEAACIAYVTDADVSCTQEPNCTIATGGDSRVAFTCPESACGALPCYFATVEQWIAHWNTFHVAVAPVITCMVAGCQAKLNTGPDTVDAFFRHVQNQHQDLKDGGKWPRLNGLIRAGMSSGPNTCFWPPSSGNGPHLRPNEVKFLTVDKMQDPFLDATWVVHTEFHDLVRKGHPKPKKSGKTCQGGRTSSWEAPGAKRRRGRDDGQSATDESGSGAASSSTSLTGTAPSTGKPVRGRPRGAGVSNAYTRQAARQQREAAEKASQPDRKSQKSLFLSL